MAAEHVVNLKDDKLGDVRLDVNSGIVYDLKGNQIAKWAVTDQPYSGELADFAAAEAMGVLCNAVEAPVRFSGSHETDRDRARAIRMRGWDGNGDGLVKMDLGAADVHLPAAIPNYAAGYRNEKPIADVVSPPFLVDKPSNKFFTFAKEDAFQRALPSIGATSAQVNEIAPRVANSTYSTIEYALGGFVGTQLEAAADAPLRIRQATMTRVLNALLIEREIRVANAVTTAATWDSTVVTTILAAAKWNGGASADPVNDLLTQMRASWGEITGIAMSRLVYDAFSTSAAVQKYFAYKDSAQARPNAAQMSAILQLPPIYVSDMQYIDTTGARSYIWGKNVALFRMPSQIPPTTQDDVASNLTFRWNGVDTVDGQAANGFIVREYFVQDRGSQGGNKVVLIQHDIEQQTSKFAGGLLVGAYQ
jgi:hypothetical protein